MRSTDTYQEVFIRLGKLRNPRIEVMLDQVNYPYLDDGWLTVDERLTFLAKLERGL